MPHRHHFLTVPDLRVHPFTLRHGHALARATILLGVDNVEDSFERISTSRVTPILYRPINHPTDSMTSSIFKVYGNPRPTTPPCQQHATDPPGNPHQLLHCQKRTRFLPVTLSIKRSAILTPSPDLVACACLATSPGSLAFSYLCPYPEHQEVVISRSANLHTQLIRQISAIYDVHIKPIESIYPIKTE